MFDSDSDVDKAKTAALNYLSSQPRTVREMRDRLLQKEFSDDTVDTVIAWLTEIGYLDDEGFAQQWVSRRHESKQASRTKLKHELRRKGIDDDTVSAALEQVTDDSEKEQAELLVERKIHSTRGLPLQTRMQRLTGMLMRRGYSAGVAVPIVKAALERDGEECPEPGD